MGQGERQVLGGKIPPEDASGGEHRVYFDERSGRYLKATIPEKQKGYGIALGSYTHGATPSEYLTGWHSKTGYLKTTSAWNAWWSKAASR